MTCDSPERCGALSCAADCQVMVGLPSIPTATSLPVTLRHSAAAIVQLCVHAIVCCARCVRARGCVCTCAWCRATIWDSAKWVGAGLATKGLPWPCSFTYCRKCRFAIADAHMPQQCVETHTCTVSRGSVGVRSPMHSTRQQWTLTHTEHVSVSDARAHFLQPTTQ